MSESSESHKGQTAPVVIGWATLVIAALAYVGDQEDSKQQRELQSRETKAVEEQVSVSKSKLKPFVKVEAIAVPNGHQITLFNVGEVSIVEGKLTIYVEREVGRGKEETNQFRVEYELPALTHSASMHIAFDKGWIEKWRTQGVSEVSGTLKVDCESKSKDPYSAKFSFSIHPIFDKAGRFTYQVISLKQITLESVRSVLPRIIHALQFFDRSSNAVDFFHLGRLKTIDIAPSERTAPYPPQRCFLFFDAI